MNPGPKPPWPRRIGWLLLAATVILTVLHSAAPVTTNDLFWHVKTGEHLWRVGGFPDRDVFSYTTGGLDWVLHEWLTQLIFYGLHQLGGLGLLRLFTGAFAALLLWQVYRFAGTRSLPPMVCAVAVLVFAGLGVCRFQTRPTLFSMALLVFEVAWLLRQRGPWRLPQTAVVIGLVLVWVNLHSVGLLGVVIFAAFVAGRLTQFMLGLPQAPSRRDLAWYAGAGIGAAATSCINPAGWSIYGFAFQDKSLVMNFIVDEWGAFHLAYADNPLLSPLAYALVLGVLATVLVAALWTGIALNRLPHKAQSPLFPDPVDLAMLALTVGGALLARRFLWLLALSLVLALVQIRRLYLARAESTDRELRLAIPGRAAVAALGLLLLGALYQIELRYENRPLHRSLADGSYFTRGIAPSLDLPGIRFMSEAGLHGNAFCHYGSGGMLSWFLYPEVKVFIDSRVDLYRRQVFLDFLRVRDGHPLQQQILDAYHTDIYFRHWEIAPLRQPAGWTKVYAGSDGEVWLRDKPDNSDNLARAAAWRKAHRLPARPR